MKIVTLAVALLLAVSVVGQNPPLNKPAPEAVTSTPRASDTMQVKILKLQKHMSELQIQAGALQEAMAKAGQDYQKSSKDLIDLVDAIYKEAGLSKDDWSFSTETFEFTKKVKKVQDESVGVGKTEEKKP